MYVTHAVMHVYTVMPYKCAHTQKCETCRHASGHTIHTHTHDTHAQVTVKDAKSKHGVVGLTMPSHATVGDVKIAVAASPEYKHECSGTLR